MGEAVDTIYSKYTQQVSFREPGRTDGRMDNVKTVYPPTNTVCGGIDIYILRSVHYTNITHSMGRVMRKPAFACM